MKFKLHLPATFLVDFFEFSYFFSALLKRRAFFMGDILFFWDIFFNYNFLLHHHYLKRAGMLH